VKALVDEAHRLGRKVAAPAMGRDEIESALRAGADTIEHGYGLDDEMIDLMIRRGTFWCPTIFVGAYVAEGRAAAGAPIWRTMVDLERQAFAKARRGSRSATAPTPAATPGRKIRPRSSRTWSATA